MTRLVVFLSFLVSVVLIIGLSNFQNGRISNEKFNLANTEKAFHQKLEKQQHELNDQQAAEEMADEGKKEKEEVKYKSVEVVIALDTPELKSGHEIYTKKGQCLTCHGRNGEGKSSQQAPKLAGQHDWYLLKQLVNMKSKERSNPKMDVYLKKLTEQDMHDVAAYLSKLPPQ